MNKDFISPFIKIITTYGKRRLNGKRISIFREQLLRILPFGIAEEVYDYYFPIDPKALNQAPKDVVRAAFIVSCVYANTDVFRHILWTDNIRKKLYNTKNLEDSNNYAQNAFMKAFEGCGYVDKEKSFIQAVFNMTCITKNEHMLFAFPPVEVNYSEGLYCVAKAGNNKLVLKIIKVVGCQNINVQILMAGACAGRNKYLVKLSNHYGGFITKSHIISSALDMTNTTNKKKDDFVKFLEQFRTKNALLQGQWSLILT
jgi:hypothetical protein